MEGGLILVSRTLGTGETHNMKKYIIAAVLLVIIAGLVWLVWIQTKLLAVTLGLLILFLVALYFVLKRM